jgi:AcrR family transcriptional regulator
MGFQRARSEEQREARRRVILDTAAAMLDEMPVSELSLNELSRRVGLAKSNVLRYFFSREAILLELLDQAWKEWIASLSGDLTFGEGTVRERGDRVADVLARSLDSRRVLCDLISTQSAVLEHNVSVEVAVRYKRASIDNATALAELIRRPLPELGEEDALKVTLMALALVAAVAPAACPPDSVLAAYESDPSLAVIRLDFADAVAMGVATVISGTLARRL